MKNKKILILLIVCLIGIILGFFAALFSQSKHLIIRNTLPTEIANNQTVQELSANIKGIIISKDQESFVLKTNSGDIKIYYDPQGMSLFLKGNTNEEIPFKDLKVGDKLSGGVSIIISNQNIVGRLGKRRVGDIIAHNFNIE